ncbi:geranylgeranyl pyrophosphate synthetase [Hirsutella rhossiliensis]|uniref:Geranylgeranyl pyrophosphate synthetase n=1 Tax=Hirsutella rhossiliensis TaxID=111463 RepID=A0A9P8SI00_9HYPO|nr:geranylgeranyl pyrophosphate synthetase [Hirsutella rhossiliensis]KAH0963678.1 geranylgeranyl pyrophosphate synthetase [Hirsutella rhossiliensis]
MAFRKSTYGRWGNYGRWGTSRDRGARSGTDYQPSPPPPLGELIKTLPLNDTGSVVSDGEEDCGISNTRLVASYSWMNGPGAKIVVPGKPPLWTPPKGPQKLREDSGVFYRDRNAASYPSHPMEPAVISIMRMHPEPLSVDFVACASTLGNLLRHVRGAGQSFRMLVEVVGQTVHLIRRENSPNESIPNVRGYGHRFLEAYTSWEPGLGRSLSHQRIVKFCLGGLDVLVRYEVDGYVGSEQPRASAGEDTADALGQMGGLRLHQDDVVTESKDGGLEVGNAGSSTPQNPILGIKTRSINARHKDNLGEQMPRLWARQSPKLVLTYHTQGVFEDVHVQDISTAIKDWEADNQAAIRQLVALLRNLARDALADEDGKLELLGREGGELELRRRLPDAGTAFSRSVRAQWEDWLDEGRKKEAVDDDGFSDGWSDDGGAKDLTACDRDCGYCGKCQY